MKSIKLLALAASCLVIVNACDSGGGGGGGDDVVSGKLTIQNPPSENVTVSIMDYSGSVTKMEQLLSVPQLPIGLASSQPPSSPIPLLDTQGSAFNGSGIYLVQITTASIRYYDKVSFSKGGAVINYNQNYYDPIRNEYISGGGSSDPSSSSGGGGNLGACFIDYALETSFDLQVCTTPIDEATCSDDYEGEFRASCPGNAVCSYEAEDDITVYVYGEDADESDCE